MTDYRKLAAPLPPPEAAGWSVPDGMSLASLQQYLPQLNVQSQGVGRPQFSGGVNIPVGDGTLGIEGRYQRPVPQAPADMGAFLRYNRSF